ncbi:branched-chain amino acid ABC transporter permease [Mobilicoccus caccae]|uniref:Branched-chain amino acid ABC transporter permease n=1 Tax=Mobilicoccus caccae TaxID=1859295 RepID=A0ABQ6INI0_9MICO|nr:branched-chain amino acid ABC transporter permease [Mobilicoccus caccae]GMA39475.1 branched-chain amino acid ABC transporter permease [Mobilicoccus caccae]
MSSALSIPLFGGRFANRAVPVLALGLLLLVVAPFMSWCYDPDVLGDLTLWFNPAPSQWAVLSLGLGGLALLSLSVVPPLRRFEPYATEGKALRALGIGTAIFMAGVLIIITVQAGGLVNAEPGAWVALAGALIVTLGSSIRESYADKELIHVRLPSWMEVLILVVFVGGFMLLAAYALGITDAARFVMLVIHVGVVMGVLAGAGLFTWLGILATKHSRVLMLAAFAAAFAFPLTQDGSDANMSIATNVLIFAATAVGLNIVVGLAGLLDLGYIAFLGAGAYVGAILSGSAFATIDWEPPFIVTALIGAIFSSILGLIIGSPTLRVSGDYLAIVTLAFGEIFRLTMFNLDGNNGPNLTRGSNGIPDIPELHLLGFDFGESHHFFGIEITRFANYYFLLLILMAFIILVFMRMNASRIGRGWIAIREDEKAAEAMGVNVFGLKLLAFAGGAFLAGLAGTVKAHHDVAVTPDSYQFLESAFLLAAVVLGGMGTVGGVIVGAVILKLLPEKLRFFSEYRLLLFGLLLVLMMRFRPEGLIASQRRKLEFHEEDDALAEKVQEVHIEEVK